MSLAHSDLDAEPARIIVVDDDPGIRDVVTEFLPVTASTSKRRATRGS